MVQVAGQDKEQGRHENFNSALQGCCRWAIGPNDECSAGVGETRFCPWVRHTLLQFVLKTSSQHSSHSLPTAPTFSADRLFFTPLSPMLNILASYLFASYRHEETDGNSSLHTRRLCPATLRDHTGLETHYPTQKTHYGFQTPHFIE